MAEPFEWPIRTVESWERLIDIAALSQPLGSPFGAAYLMRGQPDATWSLCPSLLRLLENAVAADQALEAEEKLLDAFRAQAHLFLRGYPLPEHDDYVGWWALMQHHGAPTRLLDWTASPYVAAYFAVESLWDRDGAIWVVHPYALADSFGKLPHADKPIGEVLRDPKAYHGIFALPPWSHQSERMVAQQGHFTVSVNITGDQSRLLFDASGGVEADTDRLAKLIVPADLKPVFLHRLRAMNVTATALFPGIDGLGRSLAEAARLHGFSLRT